MAVGLLAAPATAGSIDDPICADRPGLDSATCSVPKGHWQVETGLADWSLSKSGGERDTELDLAASAIKYGLTDHLNVEIDVVPLVRLTSRAAGVVNSASGFGDTVLAVKQELGPGGGPLSAAFYPFIKLPTAGRGIGNGAVEGGARVPLSLALGASPFSIAATPELDLAADGDGHGHHLAMVQVLGLGVQASKPLNLTAELAGRWDWDPAGTVRQYRAAAAAAWLAGRDLQLDGGAVFGLNRNAADVEVYGGVSLRF